MLSESRVHATLPTQDLDALREFYESTLGFTPVRANPIAVMLRAGDGTRFVVTRSGGRSEGSFTQMSFSVGDVAAEVAELRAKGVTFEDYEVPKTVDGIATTGAGRAAWFKDPAGNLIGLIEFSEPE